MGQRLMPTISKDNKVATLINVFTVEPGNQQKVVDMLVETTEKAMKHIPGFVSASIHKSLDGVRGLLPATSYPLPQARLTVDLGGPWFRLLRILFPRLD
jgi:hypothetical protein